MLGCVKSVSSLVVYMGLAGASKRLKNLEHSRFNKRKVNKSSNNMQISNSC